MDEFYKTLNAISLNQCSEIRLPGMGLDDKHAMLLAAAMEEGAQRAAEQKVDTSLTHLDLEHNVIGDEGAKVLARALHTIPTLKTFKFAYNNSSPAGDRIIDETFVANNSPSIIHVTLGEDDTLSQGLEMLIKHNKRLASPSKDYRSTITEQANCNSFQRS